MSTYSTLLVSRDYGVFCESSSESVIHKTLGYYSSYHMKYEHVATKKRERFDTFAIRFRHVNLPTKVTNGF